MDNDLGGQVDVIQKKLDRLLAERASGQQRFLGLTAAAHYCDLSPESLRRMIAAGKIRAFRPVRGKILIDTRELDSVILASTSTPRFGRGRPNRA